MEFPSREQGGGSFGKGSEEAKGTSPPRGRLEAQDIHATPGLLLCLGVLRGLQVALNTPSGALQHLLIWRRVHYSYKETIGDQGPQSHCQRQSGMETSIPSWRLACPWGDPQAPPRLLDTPTPPPTVPLQPWALTSSLHGDGAGTPGKI